MVGDAVPVTLGVPEIRPELEIESPVGRPEADQLTVGKPPADCIWNE